VAGVAFAAWSCSHQEGSSAGAGVVGIVAAGSDQAVPVAGPASDDLSSSCSVAGNDAEASVLCCVSRSRQEGLSDDFFELMNRGGPFVRDGVSSPLSSLAKESPLSSLEESSRANLEESSRASLEESSRASLEESSWASFL